MPLTNLFNFKHKQQPKVSIYDIKTQIYECIKKIVNQLELQIEFFNIRPKYYDNITAPAYLVIELNPHNWINNVDKIEKIINKNLCVDEKYCISFLIRSNNHECIAVYIWKVPYINTVVIG